MIRRVETGKGAALKDINAIIAQTEAAIGCLVGMGHDGTQSYLFFSSKKPAKAATISVWKEGSPDRNDASFIDRDDIYVENSLNFCVATRDSSS